MITRENYLKKLRRYRDNGDIKVITGVRRCGKTCLLKQLMEELKESGVSDENIIYLNFESARYAFIGDTNDLNEYVFKTAQGLSGKIYLLFDEIQQIKYWEKSINAFRVDLDCDIYITGSNSTLLAGELATLLTGRYITIDIYPFSYNELLAYYSSKKHSNMPISSKEPVLTREEELKIFNDYMKFGGFPGLLKYEDEDKEHYLKDLFNSILFRDILSKSKISDIDLLERIIDFVISNIGQIISSNSISNYLKHENRTSPKTVINYLNVITKAFIFYKIKREDIIGKKKLNVLEKYYLVDPGFYYIFNYQASGGIGQLLENIVFLELKRRNYSISIGRIKDLEVDFVCRKANETVYIQVSASILDENTREREMKSLLKIRDNYPKYVLTLDDFDLSYNGIKHLNILDFLKDENSLL